MSARPGNTPKLLPVACPSSFRSVLPEPLASSGEGFWRQPAWPSAGSGRTGDVRARPGDTPKLLLARLAMILVLPWLSAASQLQAGPPTPGRLATVEPPRASRVLFRDDFESYASDDDLWSRGGPVLNQGRRIPPPRGGVRLIRGGPHRSGQAAVELEMAGDGSHYSQAYLYYRLPLARAKGARRIGVAGWVSFTNHQDVRLFFLNEVFTGRIRPVQEYFGHRAALLAGGIQFDGRVRTWQWEKRGSSPYTPFSTPMPYKDNRDRFHYFKLVVDYETGRYHSFQFDQRQWDISENELILFEPDSAHDPTPAMIEMNVRLISFDDYDAPYHSRAYVDDVVVTVEDDSGP